MIENLSLKLSSYKKVFFEQYIKLTKMSFHEQLFSAKYENYFEMYLLSDFFSIFNKI